MKRKGILRKYNIEKKMNLDQVTEELKQNLSAKTQRFLENVKEKPILSK
jgi:hypothetical protein